MHLHLVLNGTLQKTIQGLDVMSRSEVQDLYDKLSERVAKGAQSPGEFDAEYKHTARRETRAASHLPSLRKEPGWLKKE